MRSATDRAKALKRIAAVQADLVMLADVKLAAARRERDRSVEDIERLSTFAEGDGALGVTLSTALLRTTKALEGQRAAAERDIVATTLSLRTARQRDRAVSNLAKGAAVAARREAEARELGDTMEAWLARQASLP